MRQTDSESTNGCIIYEQTNHTQSQALVSDDTLHSQANVSLPPMPAGLEPLKHQLAGHKFCDKDNKEVYGILDCKDGTILKPVILGSKKGQRERYFYELVNGVFSVNSYFNPDLYEAEVIRQLKKFTPVFKGLVTLPEHPDVIYVKMVDVCSAFVKPHIVDIKIGAKSWEPTASLEKIKRQKQRCPHLDKICFQVLGAKYYDAVTHEPIVKHDLRKYSPQDLLRTGLFEIFKGLPAGTSQTILQFIMDDLQEIVDWFRTQSHLSFHGSSVLIVFESDWKTLGMCLGENHNRSSSILQVKMIDFVHVWETTSPDTNYIEGINSLLTYLTDLSHLFSVGSSSTSI